MVMESGFSSPRSEAFPAGLRVLVVDDDPTWLKILEKMLKKCSYEVTTCGLAREALKLLRDRKDGFDIVISDVNMPDMDGFKLLEHVGLEMDLPVIMMSVDGETSRVMKGVQHGACDYLLKPIRMKELKNIWQHVVRKRMHEVRDIECFDDRNGIDHFNDGYYGGDQTLLKKRKDVNKHDEKESSDPSNTKKARVVWTVELHQKFVRAVNQLGIDSDKIGPKKILDLMNVPWLTRENVASHLQKYRLYLSRIRKEDKVESLFGGMKNSDHSPKDSSGGFSLQNSGFGQQNNVANYVYLRNQLPVQSIDSKPLDNDHESSSLLPLTENRKPFHSQNSDPHKANSSPVVPNHAFGSSLETSVNYASFDSPVAGRYPWSGEVQEFKAHQKVEDCFNQPTVSISQQHIGADLLEPAPHICPGSSLSETDNLGIIDIKLLNAKQGSDNIRQLSPIERALESLGVSNTGAFGCAFDVPLNIENQNSSQRDNSIKQEAPTIESSIQSIPIQSVSHFSDPPVLEPNANVTLDMKNQSSTQSSVIGFKPEVRNQVLGSESASGLVGEDVMFCWLQGGEFPLKDFGFDNVGFSDFSFQEQVSEVPFPLNVAKFGLECEYPFDWVEHPVDQGLLFS